MVWIQSWSKIDLATENGDGKRRRRRWMKKDGGKKNMDEDGEDG